MDETGAKFRFHCPACGKALNSPYSLKNTLGILGTDLKGSGVTVAIVDSGIYKAPDFDGRIVKSLDFTMPTGRARNTH